MHTRLLEAAPGRKLLWHDHGDGRYTIQQQTDVEGAVEWAKALHNEGYHATRGGQKHVASIPIPVLQQWAQKRGKTYADVMQDQKLMHEFLTDPDHSVFRVWKGKL